MVAVVMARQQPLPRGLRAWHVGHYEYAVTREALGSLAWKRVYQTTDNKGRMVNGHRESDGIVVPMKAGNAAGGKGAHCYDRCQGDTNRAQ